MSKDEPSGEVPAIIASQGIQVGAGNTQNNSWTMKSPVDPASLAALNPHTAVARILQLPHDEAVDVFAKASADDLADVLKALLETREATAIAILADVSPRKAAELTANIKEDWPFLEDLPGAATAIDRYAAAKKWVPAPPAERLRWEPLGFNDSGFTRTYEQARILWSRSGGVRALRGSIRDYYEPVGWRELGYPTADEVPATPSPYGGEGTMQAFGAGRVYSSARGTWSIWGKILDKYQVLGATGGWLGFPVADRGPSDTSSSQRFEGGRIYAIVGQAYSVRLRVIECVGDDDRWLPHSDEVDAPASPYSTVGASQEFAGAEDARMVVYASALGAYRVVGRKLAYYLANGATSSRLGFPRANGKRLARTGGGFVQQFEGGNLYDKAGAGVFVVPAAVVEFVPRTVGWDRLGWPVSEEQAIDGSGDDRIQFFENGAVTLRGGKREILLRP